MRKLFSCASTVLLASFLLTATAALSGCEDNKRTDVDIDTPGVDTKVKPKGEGVEIDAPGVDVKVKPKDKGGVDVDVD